MDCTLDTILVQTDSKIKVLPFQCKRWSCEDCFQTRLRRLRLEAADGLPNTFLTLTSRFRSDITPDEAARDLVRAWRNIRQRAAREGYADKIPFLAVFEETRQGWPHLHILCRAPFIPKRWLSERMAEYTDSPIVDIGRIKSRKHATWYVAKYVSKGPGRFEGCKRYWRSHDYSLAAARAAPGEYKNWDAVWCVQWTQEGIRESLAMAGWQPEADDFGRRIVWNPPFHGGIPDRLFCGVYWSTGPPGPDIDTIGGCHGNNP